MLSIAEVDDATGMMRIASYVALPLFALGILGNSILIRLSMKNEVRQLSSSAFIMGVAITDTIVLVFEVMDDIAIHLSDITAYDILFGYNQWRCRFGLFIYQTARTVSAWLMVALAAELVLAVSSPIRRKYVYIRNRTLYVFMAVVLVALAAGFPFLVLTKQDSEDAEMPTCSSTYEVFFLVYSEFVLKGAAQCLFPVLIIAACNLTSFYILSREKKSMSSGSHFENKQIAQMDRRGISQEINVQARQTIFAVTTLYILSVSPGTVAEVVILAHRFLGDFSYTWAWSLAINITGVIFLANYTLKFYCIVLFGRDYRSAFAGKSTVAAINEPEENGGPVANGVANGGYIADGSGALRRASAVDNKL